MSRHEMVEYKNELQDRYIDCNPDHPNTNVIKILLDIMEHLIELEERRLGDIP